MRQPSVWIAAFILGGCTSHVDIPPPATDGNFSYDDRDTIAGQGNGGNLDIWPVQGVKKMLVTVVNWQGENTLNQPLIEQHTLSNDPDSLRSYLLAASHGKLTLEGRVIGYTSEPRPDLCKSGSPMPLGLAVAQGVIAAQAHGLNPDDFDYLINMIDCGGNASALAPGRIVGVYGQSSGPHVYKHEFGHNLGYKHGSTYVGCPFANGVVQAPGDCNRVFLGDTGDTVSGGGTLYPAYNRWYSGWLTDAQVATIKHTGLYRLGALGGTGPQLYVIQRTNSPHQISLEYRQPTPFDNFAPQDNRVTGVWVRYTDNASTVLNTQLDATPETPTAADPTLQPNRIITDVAEGIQIKTCSVTPQGATISVGLRGSPAPYCTTSIGPPLIHVPVPQGITGVTPVIAGSSLPGAIVEVSTPSATPIRLGETVADAHGEWSVHLTTALSKGTHTVVARQAFGASQSPLSNTRTFSVGDIQVTTPVIQTPPTNTATGRTPTLEGTGIPGAQLRVVETNKPYPSLATTTVDGYGKWALQILQPLPVGTFRVAAQQTIEGRVSPWSLNHSIQIVDSPVSPVIQTPAEYLDIGTRPVFTGTGVAGASLRIVPTGMPQTTVAQTKVNPSGVWSAQVTTPLPVGDFRFSAQQILNGRVSPWSINHRVRIVDEPGRPTIETPALTIETGSRPVISGHGVIGATVRVVRSGQPSITLATTTVDGHGRWSVQPDVALPAGSVSVSSQQILDAKPSPWGLNHGFKVVDVPGRPLIEHPAQNSQTGPRPVISGPGVAGATITVVRSGAPSPVLASAIVDGHGNWSVQLPAELATGAFSVAVNQNIDGKLSPWSLNRAFTVVDTSPVKARAPSRSQAPVSD